MRLCEPLHRCCYGELVFGKASAVKIFSFARDDGHHVDQYGSDFVLAPLTDPHGRVRVACFHLGPGEFIGEHEATVDQLFCVVEGSGWVSGSDGVQSTIKSHQGAYWASGERHATGTEYGLTAIVLEGDEFSITAHEIPL